MSRHLPRQTYLREWIGAPPETGDYLETATGTTYAVISTEKPKRGTSVLKMWIWRLDPGEARKPGMPVHPFRWLR